MENVLFKAVLLKHDAWTNGGVHWNGLEGLKTIMFQTGCIKNRYDSCPVQLIKLNLLLLGILAVFRWKDLIHV